MGKTMASQTSTLQNSKNVLSGAAALL